MPQDLESPHTSQCPRPKATAIAIAAFVLSLFALGISFQSLRQQIRGIDLQTFEGVAITDVQYKAGEDSFIEKFEVRVRNESVYDVRLETVFLEWRLGGGIALVQIPLTSAAEDQLVRRGQGAVYRLDASLVGTLRKMSDVTGSTFCVVARSSSGRVFSTAGTKYDEELRDALRFFPRLRGR